MPFVQRDAGIIVAAYKRKQIAATEFLADDNPEVIAFYAARQAQEDEAAGNTPRHDEIRASQLVTDWEDRVRGKTYAEIHTAFTNATAAQRTELLEAMLMRWALEVK